VDEENVDKYAWICGWSDKNNQYERFRILSEIGVKSNDTVLDIGCGVGEYVMYCHDNGLEIKYAGIDINQNYIHIAKSRFPDHKFIVSSGWDLNSDEHDWAIASGVFTLDSYNVYLLWSVGYIMERLVKKGFAFNLLNEAASEGFVRYNSKEILSLLTDRFPKYKITVIDGYLDDDFTIYVKK